MSDNEVLMIGNVQFNKNQVQSHTTGENLLGKKINTVFMKDGTKIEFPDQNITDPKKMPSVMMGRDGAVNNPPPGIKFSNFESGKVTGTDAQDYYYIDNSRLTVDVSGGGNGDVVKTVGRKGDKQPTVFKDAGDKEININLDKDFFNMNEGLWIQG